MRNTKVKIWLLSIITVFLLTGTVLGWLLIVNSDARDFNVIVNSVDSRKITVQLFKGQDYDNNGLLEPLNETALTSSSTKMDYIKKYYDADANPLTTRPSIKNIYSDSKITFKLLISNDSDYGIKISNYLTILDGEIDGVVYNKYTAIMFGMKITGVTIYDSENYMSLLNSNEGTPISISSQTIPMVNLMDQESYLSGSLTVGSKKTAEIDFQIVAFSSNQMQDAYDKYIQNELENYWDAAGVDDTTYAQLKTSLKAANSFADMETLLTTFYNDMASTTEEEIAQKAIIGKLKSYITYNKTTVDNKILAIRNAMLDIADMGQAEERQFVISNIYTVIEHITG